MNFITEGLLCISLVLSPGNIEAGKIKEEIIKILTVPGDCAALFNVVDPSNPNSSKKVDVILCSSQESALRYNEKLTRVTIKDKLLEENVTGFGLEFNGGFPIQQVYMNTQEHQGHNCFEKDIRERGLGVFGLSGTEGRETEISTPINGLLFQTYSISCNPKVDMEKIGTPIGRTCHEFVHNFSIGLEVKEVQGGRDIVSYPPGNSFLYSHKICSQEATGI